MPGYNPEDYDLAGAFESIEHELIESMMRNIRRHQKWEKEEGFNWSQWQAEQLRSLEKYRRENLKKYPMEFARLNDLIGQAIAQARATGQADQEVAILEAVQMGWLKDQQPDEEIAGQFFRQNDRKMNALVKATTDDMQKAEYAILRRANDEYRKIVFKAVAIANTGSMNYDQCIDMATQDMRRAGLQCVEYKNGSRHRLDDYADMVIKTTTKRAYLTGEGEMRKQWGISTVIVNKRATACPKCLPWTGKVFIDDVWSGGSASDGKYPLISEAMEAGLYHPRCKDSHTTYFPGISTADDTWTKKELEQLETANKLENQEQEAERQAKSHERQAEFALDPEEKAKETARAEQKAQEAESKQQELVKMVEGYEEEKIPQRQEDLIEFVPAETIEEAQEYASTYVKNSLMARTFKGEVNFKGISLENANSINRALTEVYNQFPDLDKLSGIKVVSPGSAQGKKAFKSGSDAVFAYNPIEHGIYINKDILKSNESLELYLRDSEDAWNTVMGNIDKLSGPQKDLALRYKEAGRDLVSGTTVEGLFTHELGHHVQWTMLDPKTTNSLTSRASKFAPKISGYATNSGSEYLAESFAAYMKGERDLLDPEYVSFLDKKSLQKQRTKMVEGYEKKRLTHTVLPEMQELPTAKATEFEAKKMDYIEARTFAEGDARLTNMLCSNDCQQISTAVDEILKKELDNQSCWTGKTKAVQNGSLGLKIVGRAEWDNSISICDDYINDIKVHIHEHLHLRSINRYGIYKGPSLLGQFRSLEEGTVELLSQEICEKHGIRYRASYSLYVEALKRIKEITLPRLSNYQFAKNLLDLPVEERYNYINKCVSDYEKNIVRIRPSVREKLEEAMKILKKKEVISNDA